MFALLHFGLNNNCHTEDRGPQRTWHVSHLLWRFQADGDFEPEFSCHELFDIILLLDISFLLRQ